jgi:hypothetical protein
MSRITHTIVQITLLITVCSVLYANGITLTFMIPTGYVLGFLSGWYWEQN